LSPNPLIFLIDIFLCSSDIPISTHSSFFLLSAGAGFRTENTANSKIIKACLLGMKICISLSSLGKFYRLMIPLYWPWLLGLCMEMLFVASSEYSLERLELLLIHSIFLNRHVFRAIGLFESLFASNMVNDAMHAAAFKQSSLSELVALSDLEFFSFSLDPALHALLEIHWPYRVFGIEMRN